MHHTSEIYSAAIVLAHQMDKQGNLNDETLARMDLAISAYESGQTTLIVTCGWPYRNDSPIAIADAMKTYAIHTRGLPEHAVIADTSSRDTVGDAVFTKRHYARKKAWTKLLVTTSAYHAARTQDIFRFIYGSAFEIDVRGAEQFAGRQYEASEKKSIEAFHQTFAGVQAGDDEAIFEALRTRHPFYNGVTYPKIES